MNRNEKEQMVELIEKKRVKMVNAANLYGSSSQTTLKYSMELDNLITKYQTLVVAINKDQN